MTFTKNDKVKITNIAGDIVDSTSDPKYRIIGQTGYVLVTPTTDWVQVIIPTHLYYSKGNGAALKVDELELLEEAHPLQKEFAKS